MRRPTTRTALRAAAAALALSLTLAACAGDDTSDDATTTPTAQDTAAATEQPTASAEDIAALESVTVEGAAGAEPQVVLPSTPFTMSAAAARVLDEGTGETIVDGDLIDLHSVWVAGNDGTTQQSTWASAPEQIVVSEASLAPVLADILVDGKVGMRFVFGVPMGEDVTSVAVAEVVAKRPGRADGTAVAPADGLPTVTLADDGAPTLEPAEGDAPTALVAQPLIEGAGPEIAPGQTALVHYTGWLWDGTQFDSSWERSTPFPVENVGQASVIAGWNEGLVGQKVGSQVMLVVPPDKGYGDEEKEGIPPGSTLVFVVDILAAS